MNLFNDEDGKYLLKSFKFSILSLRSPCFLLHRSVVDNNDDERKRVQVETLSDMETRAAHEK